jgi:ribonuclease/clavin/mitogillin
MSEADRTTIVNVGYRSTNYWVVSAGTSRLPVDLGWPGTIGDFADVAVDGIL